MRLTAKILAILILAALASPVFILNACGSLNGKACGGCPDSTAPSDSSLVITNGLGSYTVTPGTYCVNRVTFTVMAADNVTPMQGICVELFTNSGIALSQGGIDCTDPSIAYSQYIRTRTDSGGTVTVDFTTGALSNSTCGGTSPKDQKVSLFVQASSCTKGATTTGTWTVQCP